MRGARLRASSALSPRDGLKDPAPQALINSLRGRCPEVRVIMRHSVSFSIIAALLAAPAMAFALLTLP